MAKCPQHLEETLLELSPAEPLCRSCQPTRWAQRLLETGRGQEAAAALMNFGWLMGLLAPSAEGSPRPSGRRRGAARPEGQPSHAAELVALFAGAEAALPSDSALARWASCFRANAEGIARDGAVALLQAAIADVDASPIRSAAEEWSSAKGFAGRWLRRVDRPLETRPEPPLRIFEGAVEQMASGFLERGRWLVCGGPKHTIALWDLSLESATPVKTYQGPSRVTHFALATEGPEVVAAFYHAVVRWNPWTGKSSLSPGTWIAPGAAHTIASAPPSA